MTKDEISSEIKKLKERALLDNVPIMQDEGMQFLRKYIADTDPKAFVTFTQTKAVYGEGFKKHIK